MLGWSGSTFTRADSPVPSVGVGHAGAAPRWEPVGHGNDHQRGGAHHEHHADRNDAGAVAPLADAGVPEHANGDYEVCDDYAVEHAQGLHHQCGSAWLGGWHAHGERNAAGYLVVAGRRR
jgi:hypothetical protein